MARLKSMMVLFMQITTGVLFVTAVYITVFKRNERFAVKLLWQILIVSLVCTLGSLIVPLEEVKEVSKRSMQVHMILYYIFINIAVLFCGTKFRWFDFNNIKQLAGMLLSIAFVFGTLAMFSYWLASREAAKLNRKLKERK